MISETQVLLDETTTAAGMMKAVRIHEYGGPDVLKYEDAPRPVPGEGEVLVKVHAAGVNPIDWKIRGGYLSERLTRPLPFILGWDVSGVIESMGHGVNRFRKGDEIFTRPDTSRDGAYAEYIVIRENELAIKPMSIDHVHAAAVPLASLTAWQALFDAGGLVEGQRVLIHGAAGGVGSFAVQLAKWKGAEVIGTGSGRNQDFIRDLGADQAVDYETASFEDILRDVDVVLDTIGGDTQDRSWKVLKKGGILVSLVAPPSEEEAESLGVRETIIMARTNTAQLAEIADLIDMGDLKVHVEAAFPLAEARQAHEMSESHHARGKIVLRVR